MRRSDRRRRRSNRLGRWIPLLAALVAVLAAAAVPVAWGAQSGDLRLERILAYTHGSSDPALTNSKLDIGDGDDLRVDVDVAILDTGVDLDHRDLNIAGGVSCVNAVAPTYVCDRDPSNDVDGDDAGDEVDRDGDDTNPYAGGHGTGFALGVGALDNDLDSVGTAPGARIWAVDVLGDEVYPPLPPPPALRQITADMDAIVAGVKWVTSTRTDSNTTNDIDVALMGVACATAHDPEVHQPECPSEDGGEALEDAVNDAIAHGVVVVSGGSNLNRNVNEIVPQRFPDLLLFSTMFDSDGKPGGLVDGACNEPPSRTPIHQDDDTLSNTSNWGQLVDMTTPGGCVSSSAVQIAAGAAAVLTSRFNPTTRNEVVGSPGDANTPATGIHGRMIRAGNTASAANGGWDDTGGPLNAGDGYKEPLLDMSDESLYDPTMVPGCDPSSNPPEAESDVNGDGRSDLVTVRDDGIVTVRAGGTGHVFGTATHSYRVGDTGLLNSALFRGEGHHVVDVADVTADGCADLVTLHSDGTVYVSPGRPNMTFSPGTPSFDGGMTPALHAPGGHEPIGVADVDGDGHADLVTYNDVTDKLMVYRGQHAESIIGGDKEVGSFDEDAPIEAESSVSSALHTGSGEYFVDVADVTGDGRADLVSMKTSNDDLLVRPGRSDGDFDAAVSSAAGSPSVVADVAMDDGDGFEPVGLGDVTGPDSGDGKARADLVLQKAGTTYVYKGNSNGRFSTPQTSFAGLVTSTTFGGGAFEIIGVLDVNGDGFGDLPSVYSAGDIKIAKGQASGVFTSSQSTLTGFKTTQFYKHQDVTGHELANEKPSYRRRGCTATGCRPSPPMMGDTIGMFRPSDGNWHLRNNNTAGVSNLSFGYNWAASTDVPLTGDWDGDGDDTVGVYLPSTGTWNLRNSNSSGAADSSFAYHWSTAADIPVAGDWDGDGDDTIGMYRPGDGMWHLRDSNSAGAPDNSFFWSALTPGDIPVIGDWDGDGDDTIGMYRPSTGMWHLKSGNAATTTGNLVFSFTWNVAGDLPVAGDWDGDGDDTIGMYRPSTGKWHLRNSNSAGSTDVEFSYTWSAPADIPVVGNWDGA